MAGLAGAIADAGLSILSAHIDGYGERAVDAFYVVGADGGKLTDARRTASLKSTLLAALDAAESQPPARNRAALQRARASVAR
jgi:[protein-PII] uridylyltransferase